MSTALRILQVVGVIACLCLAALLATPPGRLPLALRGLQRILRKDADSKLPPVPCPLPTSPARRFTAFLLLVLAVILAVL